MKFLLEILRELKHYRFYTEGGKHTLRFEVPAKSKTPIFLPCMADVKII